LPEENISAETVSRLAESLRPLGPAARVVAELTACVTEMRRLKVDGKQIDASKDERLAALADRRAAVSGALQGMRNNGELLRLSASGLLDCINTEQRRLAQINSLKKQQLSLTLIEVLGNLLSAETAKGRAGVTDYIDGVLNGAGAPVWMPRNGARPTAGGGSRNEGKRRGRKRGTS
jgi:hypothetical protein